MQFGYIHSIDITAHSHCIYIYMYSFKNYLKTSAIYVLYEGHLDWLTNMNQEV